MTWSIVARDASGALGVAVATKFFAAGALCTHVRAGVAALATQALVNPLYGPRGLDRLERGEDPASVVAALIGTDDGREQRQLHMIDAKGRTASHTGTQCIDWCGQVAGIDFSVAGNMLAGPRVVDDTAAFFAAHPELSFAERLIGALEAGEAVGGDKRGKQSAALLIHTTETYPALDLRVDDSIDPLRELRRLYDISLERFQPFLACMPSTSRPSGIIDRALIEAAIERFHADRARAAQ
jgi:uncharacterized Ntn-hydrolase superfamily protein